MEIMAVFRLGSLRSKVILILVLLQCISAVLTQNVFATIVARQETCANYVENRDCKFYSECVESRVPCGEGDYALGYGHKYCNRFLDHRDKFDDEASQL